MEASSTSSDAVRRVYLDHAATTPLDPVALAAMMPYLGAVFGNANALYREGRSAYDALERARHTIAGLIGAKRPDEVVFTSGGTESDNAALQGLVAGIGKRHDGIHVVTSAIEHDAVLNVARRLESAGVEVTYLKPRRDGFVHPSDLTDALRSNTALVSIMAANNEIGTVQPVCELARVAHEAGCLFHTDAVQALGKVDLHLESSAVDAASFSAHKVYGPKGSGALYLRRRTPFVTQMAGGGQEANRRSGTQNVAAAVGFASALGICCEAMEEENARLAALRDQLIGEMLAVSPRVHLTVDPRDEGIQDGWQRRYLAGLASFVVEGIETETMVLRLDEAGFAVSGGSACATASLDPSHVLVAIGINRDLAYGALRISLGRANTSDDISRFTSAFSRAI